MSYDDEPREVLDDIESYAKHAINDIRDLQERMRANARRLGLHGAFLFAAADMLDDVMHDELTPVLTLVSEAMEFAPPSHLTSDRADYHACLGVQTGPV